MSYKRKGMGKNINDMERLSVSKYDSLSKIYNRKYFYEITDEMLRENHDEKFVMVNMDIWNFKLVNELYGDDQGDLVLEEIGNAVLEFFDNYKHVTYCREQADIFYICFKYEEKLVNEFVEYMNSVLNKNNFNIPLKLYFGAIIIDENEQNICHICHSAKLALKTIKGKHNKTVAYFNEDIRQDFKKKIDITNDMYKALENEEFEVYLQPKYNILTNSCVGAEALVRWIHPQKGLIYPGDFIPVFEENEFISKLDEYMFEKTCILLKKWLEDDKKVVPISVNVSQVYLRNENLYDTFTGLLEKYQVPVDLIELEITETSYIENSEQLKNLINKLQVYGFKIHMDDFGSGCSSLSVLSELPVDVIKMDMRFLDNLTETNKGKNIISTVVGMAKSLGVFIIAEGIENINHVKFLQNVGCIVGQGYHFSRPIKVEEFEDKYLIDRKDSMNYVKDSKESKVISWDINKLAKEEEVLSEALGECNICVWEYDILNNRIIQTSASKRIHGNNKVIENVPCSLIKSGHVHEDSVGEFMTMYRLVQGGAKEGNCIIKVRKPDGSYCWEKINYITSFDKEGKPVRALGISSDVTSIMANKKDKEVLEIAYKDELTAIGNKRACFNYVSELIDNKCDFSLSYIKLNGLENMNKIFGYNKCDKYIKQAVDAVKASIRGDEQIFRLGEDEFIYIDSNNDIEYINERLLLLDYKIKSLNLHDECSISYATIEVSVDNKLNCEEIIAEVYAKM